MILGEKIMFNVRKKLNILNFNWQCSEKVNLIWFGFLQQPSTTQIIATAAWQNNNKIRNWITKLLTLNFFLHYLLRNGM